MSSRLYKPLSEWTEEDLAALVTEQVEEGQRLEFKQELPLGSKSERVEAAKDASGMANAVGGLLIYGIKETKLPDRRRVPTKLTPLPAGDTQARLEDILASAVVPRLNMTAATIPAASGGYYLLVHVEPRSGPLHMVQGYDQHRYFIRSGLSTRPMAAHEVEQAFRELRGADERIEKALEQLPLIPRIVRNRAEDFGMEPHSSPWVSVVCAPLDAPDTLIQMRRPTPSDFLDPPALDFIGKREYVIGGMFTIDADGYVRDDRQGQTLFRRVRIFRSGWLEWGMRYNAAEKWRPIPSRTFTENIHDALTYFAWIYSEIGYFGRVRTWVRVDNADHAEFKVSDRYDDPPRRPATDAISFQEDTNVERLLAGPMPLVHAAMDMVWQGYGMPRALLFTPDGKFAPRD